MQKKNARIDFSGQDIYVGLDTGKKNWKVTILTEAGYFGFWIHDALRNMTANTHRLL